MRTTTSGTNVLSLGVATNERWKEKATGEMKERTEYHNVVIWAELAKAVQEHIRKGSRVHVTGRVQTRSFETQSGQKRSVTEIVADTVTLLGVKSSEALSALQPSTALEANNPQDTNTGMNIPEVKYESEIKPEDLPF
jgi:single-strand DNA-binding protein